MSTSAQPQPPQVNGEFQIVPIASVYESKTNPRTHFDEAKLAELAKSVKSDGIVEPLVVRRNGQNGRYELVAGARRYRAGKIAGLPEVPVRIFEMSDQKVLEIQLIENLQREDVHEMDEGLGFRRLLELKNGQGKPAHTVETLAVALGKSTSYVYQRVKLAALESPIQKGFYAGHITAGHAILLARLQPEDQKRGYDATVDRDWSVRSLAQWIEREVHLDLNAARFKKDDATLVPSAGACVDCPKRTGFQPALFADVKKKDICTDRACYQAKVAALVELKVKECSATSPGLRLSSHYHNQYGVRVQKGVFYSDQFHKADGKKCNSLQTGVLIDGPDAGIAISVCTVRTCKTHWPVYGRHQSTAAEKAKRAKEIENAKIEAAVRKRAVDAVTQRVKPPLSGQVLALVAQRLLCEMQQESRKDLAKTLGIDPAREKWGGLDFSGPIRTWLKRASEQDCAQFLVLATMGTPGMYQPDETKKLFPETAARFKVDIEAIRREVTAEFAAKKKPAAKAKARTAGGAR